MMLPRLKDGWPPRWLFRLSRDRRGSTAFFMAAALVPAIGMLGSAIDLGRMYVTRSQLQVGVDAAALAGARAFQVSGEQPDSRESQVAAYFADNFPIGYMGSENLNLAPSFEKSNGINTTVVAAKVTLPMTFMRAFGFGSQVVQVRAKAEIQPRPLEVMMVLDNTGSLKDMLPQDANGVAKTRITALKDAAKSFFDVLYQGADTRPDLALGMVTYDITVNVGKVLTDWRSGSVRQLYGFNDTLAAGYGAWPTNRLAWKGCVFGDDTVRNLNDTLTFRENGAWDIDRTLPGEGAHPPVSPYFIPPMYVPRLKPSDTTRNPKDPNNGYYAVSGVEPNNNLYRLDPAYSDRLLNPASYAAAPQYEGYRRWFYLMYLGLNDTAANAANDVITRTDGSFYDPATMSWDFGTKTGTPFLIKYDRVPQFTTNWKAATEYRVNPLGGSTNNGSVNRTEFPTPNWQCPEEAVPIAYGRAKSFYVDQINNRNAAIYPANGTLHHAGLLWGYRLLVRDDAFRRTNPTNEVPKRALVFMTDGETALGTDQNGYTDRTWTFYGNYADAPISATAGGLTGQSERRFAKTCAALQAEANPPKVYIVALTTTDRNTLAMFEKCAPGHVYRTSDAATLKSAFNDIAAELVDLHLIN